MSKTMAEVLAEHQRKTGLRVVWKRPEKPCDDAESCCGSGASCDAMRPSAYAVGTDWLRARAVAERGGADACDR